jgi:V-type H+-transporting ATPase subunit C
MTQLWIISLPGTDDDSKVVDTLKLELNNQSTGPLARALPFEIPQLPIGSLDSLMSLSDDLIKINTQVEV